MDSLAVAPINCDRNSAGPIPLPMPPSQRAALCGARKQLALTQQQLALEAWEGVHFIVDLDVGKSTGRLKHVLRVIDALAGEIQLSGLPEQCEGDVHGATSGA